MKYLPDLIPFIGLALLGYGLFLFKPWVGIAVPGALLFVYGVAIDMAASFAPKKVEC